MLGYGGSPDVGRLASEAAEEIGGNQFFEAEYSNPLESLEHYCRSSLGFQRLAYAQGIAAAALTAAYQDCVDVLLPLVEQLTRDNEPEIRNVAVQQIRGLGTALHRKDAERSLRDIEQSLLVCAQQCALDDEEEVSQAAILSFEELVQLLPAARATAASKRAVDRLESNATDDGTLAAVRLLPHTVHTWTPEALRRHVCRYINRWTNHREFSVREAVGTCMSLVVKAMPLQLCHQLLLPFFYQLCRDSNWRVRRACSADLPRLAQAMQHHQLQQQELKRHPGDHSQHSNRSYNSNAEGSNHGSSSSSDGSVTGEGSCCTKTSSCLQSHRHPSDLASLSTGNLMALGNSSTGLMHRNRSSAAVNVSLQPATTAQISAKHPMHSSFIRDGLSSAAASPSSSAPPSPTSQHQPSSNDGRQQDQQQHHHSRSTDSLQSQADHSQSNCPLEASSPVLHDCWCALRQCMELLSADSSHWVKVAAMSGLGPFLLTVPSCQIGLLLLGRYTSMAGSTVVIYEISVALSCAQHFGPLVVRLGAGRWHEMRDAWQSLQTSRDPAVLCELIKCMPSLMAALGPAITCQELLPALAVLLQSHLTWIAGQLVAVLGELMEALPPSSQDLILKVLEQLSSPHGERSKQWRLRRDLALQLGRMAAATGSEAITDSIWPAAMALCCDPVFSVRVAAASQIGPLLAALPGSLLSPRGDDGACSYRSGTARSPQDLLRLVSRPEISASDGGSSDSSRSSISTDTHEDALEVNTTANGLNGGTEVTSNSSMHQDMVDTAQSGPDVVLQQQSATVAAAAAAAAAVGATANGNGHNRSSPITVKPANVIVYGVSSGNGANKHTNHWQQYGDGRSSADFELDLPSALAPAPADAFATGAAADGSTSSSCSSSEGDMGSSSDSDSRSSSSSSVGSDSDEEPTEVSRGSSKQPQYSAVMHPALQYQLPPLQRPPAPQQQQPEQQTSDIYNIRRTVVVTQAEPTTSSVLPAVSAVQQEERQQPTPPPAVHPAMMPIGHPAMMPVGRTSNASQPRPVPTATATRLAPRTPPLPSTGTPTTSTSLLSAPVAHLKAKSAGDLLKVEAAGQPQHRRRNSSCSMPEREPKPVMKDSSEGSISSRQQNGYVSVLPDPGIAAPHQYVSCLLAYFGCSSNFQLRQLFVPLAMGVLAACYDKLTCEQAGQMLDRLEALATDAVPGVRIAVAAALQHLKQHAAALLGSQAQQKQAHLQLNGVTPPEQQQHKQQEHSSCDGDQTQQHDGQGQEHSSSVAVDSYAAYVQQLASRSGPLEPTKDPSKGPGSAKAQPAVAAVADGLPSGDGSADVESSACGSACDLCGLLLRQEEDGENLGWLRKLCSCQQLERLMGVVALTTGPL